MISKPMLAGKLESEEDVKFPVWATPKLDGIRCLIINGKAVTRKFKPVPNKHIRSLLEKHCLDGFDGEIMSKGVSFNDLQSLVMTEEGTPSFEYHVFDYVKTSLKKPYLERIDDLIEAVKKIEVDFVKIISPEIVPNLDMLLKMEKLYLDAGYEGIMLRTAESPYKCGRSTVREGYLLKLKRFLDSEAKIIDIEQFHHNANELEKDAFGYAKRSSKKEGKIPLDMLGSFIVEDISTRAQFRVASGLTEEERKSYWKIKDKLIGKFVKYKYQGHGMKKLPRFPVFLGFRDERDF